MSRRRGGPAGFLPLLLLVLPALILAGEWAAGTLGPRPHTALIHGAGLWALRLLPATLAISPLAVLLAWPGLRRQRRRAGVAAALYGGAHLLLYAWDQGWRGAVVAHEILARPYLTIGFIALLGLALLALTSTDGWMRRLGRGWRRLHLLVFPVLVLALWHFAWQSKSNVSQPVLLTGLALFLLGWRLLPRRRQGSLPAALGLALLAPSGAALAEAGWYWVRNHADPTLVLRANLDTRFGLRPAAGDAVALLGVVALAGLRRLRPGRLRASPAR
jgi:sulfoxide reductase heme-binding subunit YedZ